MRILAISDTESPYLYDHFDPKNFTDIDLILSAGDLKASYLSFLATVLPVPLLYVHGNHDGAFKEHPAEGCICIEDKVYIHQGVRITGIGGCIEYSGGPFQYTESSMWWRITRNHLKYHKGIDIFLTHSPVFGIGDGKDQAHIGFKCFKTLIEHYKPKYLIHGHQHLNYGSNQRHYYYNNTKIINAYGYTIVEY